jgi:hypothetical protein
MRAGLSTHARKPVATRSAGSMSGSPRSVLADGAPCSFMSKIQAPSVPPLPSARTAMRSDPRLPVPAMRSAQSRISNEPLLGRSSRESTYFRNAFGTFSRNSLGRSA